MNCHYCGAEIINGDQFCRYCGTRHEPAPKAAPVQEPQVAYTPEPAPVIQSAPVQKTAYVPYGAPEQTTRPRIQLPTGRGLAKMFFLGLITLGIYPIVIWCKIVTELNIAASRYDGERTMSFPAMCWLAPITLGIYCFVWIHGFCRRIGAELQRRGIAYKFGASTFWLWNILGSLILVGPFIYIHKLMKSMNLINQDFNVNG